MMALLRRILFQFDPETAHRLAVTSLQIAYQTGLSTLFPRIPSSPCTVMGLTFPNPVGLAAGFDKNADYVDALAALGFGFIEVGTLTPKPQMGNPRPRLFRLTPQQALINRMGFNNKGVEYAAKRLAQTNYRGILGINIGKNKETPLEHAIDDYRLCFRQLWRYASYITINISSPNTPRLRDLQQGDALQELLSAMKREQELVAATKYVPLVVKIAPDMSELQLQALAQVLSAEKIDGVIATNTTISREGVEQSPYRHEAGGLSGKPLQTRSTDTIKKLHSLLPNTIPIIASGGVMDSQSAQEKIAAGAKLVQVYTGFIYHGPNIIRMLNL